MVKIEISLTGNQGTDWPYMEVCCGDTVLWNDQVVGDQIITYNFEPTGTNTIVLRHYNKNNDTTVDDAGNIVLDRHCLLNYVKINDLTINANILSHYRYYFKANDGEIINSNYFGKDGKFVLDFAWPLWQFWCDSECRRTP